MRVMFKWEESGTLQVAKFNLLREGARDKAIQMLQNRNLHRVLFMENYRWKETTEQHLMMLLSS
jgi:hypothetical protein